MMDEYKWTDNSRKMFDEVLLVTPRMFRPISRKALIRGFQEKQLTKVTEEEFILRNSGTPDSGIGSQENHTHIDNTEEC